MLKTNKGEVGRALAGAIIGTALPLWLHVEAARVGDTEICGVPLAFFALPGFFLGAIFGASLTYKRSEK